MFLMSFHPKLLFVGLILVLLSFGSDRREIIDEDVVVPPSDYVEWSQSLPRGARIDLQADTEIEANDSLKVVLAAYLLEEEGFSQYASQGGSLSDLGPGQRIWIYAWGPSWGSYKVPHRSTWHIVLDNVRIVEDRDLEKPVHVSASLITGYGILLVPGMLLMVLGLTPLMRR